MSQMMSKLPYLCFILSGFRFVDAVIGTCADSRFFCVIARCAASASLSASRSAKKSFSPSCSTSLRYLHKSGGGGGGQRHGGVEEAYWLNGRVVGWGGDGGAQVDKVRVDNYKGGGTMPRATYSMSVNTCQLSLRRISSRALKP